jgi:hypothetical protein
VTRRELSARTHLRADAGRVGGPQSGMRVSEQSLEGMQSLLAQQNEALRQLMEVGAPQPSSIQGPD